MDDLLSALDQGHISVLSLLDLLSAFAFDTIDYKVLIQRVQLVFGITGHAVSWVESYLKDRTQTVTVGGFESNPCALYFGVPQGSVPGQLLFVMYTQPLSDVIKSHSVSHVSYADDTQLHDHSLPREACTVVKHSEACISDVKSWMSVNKLKLNDSKTEAVLASPRCSVTEPLPTSLAS